MIKIDLNINEIDIIISWARVSDSEYGLDQVNEYELYQRLVELKESLPLDDKNDL